MSRILQREPDWTLLPATLSPEIHKLIRLCLAKDVKKRRQSAGDVRIDIERVLAEPALVAPQQVRSVRSAALAWIVAAVSLLVVVVIATLSGRQKPPETYSIRFAVLPPHDGTFGSAFVTPFQAISPNGQRIVFVARAKDASTNTLWMRSLDSMEPEQLRGTENATLPF